MEFIGTHVTAEFYGISEVVLTDPSIMKDFLVEAVEQAGANVLGESIAMLNPGYTLVLLLSESHASIHTYPENDSCFIDIFTCGRECEPDKAIDILAHHLSPTQYDRRSIDRGRV